MKNDSPQNFNCDFAPEIVDFVYGEMKAERKNVFDVHLNKCSNCADEIAEFSGIRFSIQDWKSAEFDNLATPEINIPYEVSALKTIENEKPAGWLDSIRSYLTLSPLMSGAMAAVLIAFLAGFGYFVLNNNDGKLMAVSNTEANNINQPIAVPQKSIEEKKEFVENAPVVSDEKNPVEKIENEPAEKRVPVQITNKSNQKQKSSAVKTIDKKQAGFDSTVSDKNPKSTPVYKKPRLNELPEEVEDNSLRLADLFAELETKK